MHRRGFPRNPADDRLNSLPEQVGSIQMPLFRVDSLIELILWWASFLQQFEIEARYAHLSALPEARRFVV
jgi:hypothetical protein